MMAQRSVEVVFAKKPINCIYTLPSTNEVESTTPALIFTHGAGGTLQSEAVANFVDGFISSPSKSSIICFQGNMNLKSRAKMFTAVINSGREQPELEITTSPQCLGGRSMGARAAVMAITEETTHLVLISYPLHTDKETRDQILLDLPEFMKVIFVSGEHDTMCDLKRLEDVRKKMTCKTWRVVVQAADHGMNIKPKAATQEMGKATGRVVANWLASSDDNLREGWIIWDAENEITQWSGWSSKRQDLATPKNEMAGSLSEEASKSKLKARSQAEKPKRKASSRKRNRVVVDVNPTNDDIKLPSRKRRKT